MPDNESFLKLVQSMSTSLQEQFRSVRSLILQPFDQESAQQKQDGSMVTHVDHDVEEHIMKAMKSAYPDIKIYGEETGYSDADLPDACWLIDPIDGTASFIAGEPYFTCMAVFIKDKQPISCIIYNPTTDDMYTAFIGKGAWLNGKKLDLTSHPLPAHTIAKSKHVEPLNQILAGSPVDCINAVGGGGYGFTQVVSGKVAARFQIRGKGQSHDYAPGALLIKEAGGAVLPLHDIPYSYDNRSFAVCHPELVPIIETNREQIKALEAIPY